MGGFEFLGSIGALLFFIFMVLAVLIPVWLYLINVYTYQTRNEVRKLNKNIERLADVIENKKESTPVADLGGAIETQCKNCGKRFRHSANISGTTKECPKCGRPILFN